VPCPCLSSGFMAGHCHRRVPGASSRRARLAHPQMPCSPPHAACSAAALTFGDVQVLRRHCDQKRRPSEWDRVSTERSLALLPRCRGPIYLSPASLLLAPAPFASAPPFAPLTLCLCSFAPLNLPPQPFAPLPLCSLPHLAGCRPRSLPRPGGATRQGAAGGRPRR
jgi:hypothetical protein